MSNRYQEAFCVGDIVLDKKSGKVGTVKVAEPFFCSKQTVVVQTSEGAKGMVAMEIPRLMRGDTSGPLRRLGTPPTLQPGDEVFVAQDPRRWLVKRVGPHGSVDVYAPGAPSYPALTVQWPKYRKAKKDRGGLGKFRRGDLVKINGQPDYCWEEIVALDVEGKNVAIRLKDGLRYSRGMFALLERKEKAPTVKEQSAPTHRPSTTISKEPMSHIRVGHLENTLDLVKRFHLEKDGNQAALLADNLLESLNRLSPVCAIRGSFDIVFDRAESALNHRRDVRRVLAKCYTKTPG